MSTIDVVMTGDEAKLWRSFQKIVAGQKTMEDGFEKVKKKAAETEKAIEKVGESGIQAYGSKAANALAGFASGFASVNAIVDMVNQSLQKMKIDTAAAASSIERLNEQRKDMSQLATSASDYNQMTAKAGQLSVKYGLDQAEATKITNAARAGGFEKGIDQVALASATFATSDELIPTAASLPSIFPGLTPEQALNLVAAGGTAAKNMTFKGIAQQSRSAAQGAGPAGSSAVETVAMVTELSDLFGESTGDRVRAWGSKVAMNPALRGKGMMGAFDELKKNKSLRKEFLGDSQELHAVYNKLQAGSAERVREMEAHLQSQMDKSGTNESPLMVGANSYLANREQRALYERNRARQANEVQQQSELGVGGLNMEAGKESVRAFLSKQKASAFERWSSDKAMEIADTFSDDVGWVQSQGVRSNTPDGIAFLQEQKRMREAQERAAKSLESAAANLNNATKSRSDAQRAEAQGNRE